MNSHAHALRFCSSAARVEKCNLPVMGHFVSRRPEIDNTEGVVSDFGEGRLNLLQSNTAPPLGAQCRGQSRLLLVA